jgi:WD40 repeat protein
LIAHHKEYTGHQGLVTCSSFLSKDYFLSGSNDSTIFLWEVDQARHVARFDDHTSEVYALDVAQMDGNIFASSSSDLSFRIWDIRMKKPCFRNYDKN